MSILIKAGAGLVAGMVAGALGLVFFPRPEDNALKPRAAVEKPQFVVAPAGQTPSAAPSPRATATVALAEEAPRPNKPAPAPVIAPSPAASVAAPKTAPPTPVAVAQIDPGKLAPPINTLKPSAPRASIVAEAPAPAEPSPETQRAAAAEAPALTKAMTSQVQRPATPASDASASWSVRGLVALAKGDLSSARVYLSRAADAGDPRALVALADTYDPLILSKLGVVGAPGDPQRAKDYLTKAAAAGVVVAKDRMAAIDQNAH